MSAKARQAMRQLAGARGLLTLDGEVFEELFGLATGVIDGAEHRALAIVGAALLEDALREAISKHLNPRRKREADVQLFEDEHAPLQSLASRTRMAFALGLLSEDLKRDFNDIRMIRVAFAHSPVRVSFSHKDIRVLLDSLASINKFLPREAMEELRKLSPVHYDAARFATAVSSLCGALSLHVPFWHPQRMLARTLLNASLHKPTAHDHSEGESSSELPTPPPDPPPSSRG